MKLIDLQPQWITEHIFVLLCPHCKSIWLSCKDIKLSVHEQYDLFETLRDQSGMDVVPCKPETCWTTTSKDFGSMSVSPSLDASASGHWHGTINNGVCQ